MICPHCNAEVFVSNVLIRCLRCLRDIPKEMIPRKPIKLNQKDEIDTKEVSTVGFMEKSLGKDLNSHFKTIILMLAEGRVPEYEMVSEFEVNKFEDYLKKNRVNYVKRSIFPIMKEPSYFFSLPEEG